MEIISTFFGNQFNIIVTSIITAAITSVIVSFLANKLYFSMHKNEHLYNFERDGLPSVTVYQEFDRKKINEGCEFKNNSKFGILKKYIKNQEIETGYFYKLESISLNEIDKLGSDKNIIKYQLVIINNKTEKLFQLNRIIIEQNEVFEFDNSDYSILYGKNSYLFFVPCNYPFVPKVEMCYEKYLISYHSAEHKKDNLLKPKTKMGRV